MRPRHDPGALLTHPVILVALAIWALNDRVLKTAWPGWLTGKLSDVACLIVIPALVAGSIELLRHRLRRPAPATLWLYGTALGAAAVMALINLWPPAGRAYEVGLGALQLPVRSLWAALMSQPSPSFHPVALTMDPTDVATVPAAALPLWLARDRG